MKRESESQGEMGEEREGASTSQRLKAGPSPPQKEPAHQPP